MSRALRMGNTATRSFQAPPRMDDALPAIWYHAVRAYRPSEGEKLLSSPATATAI
jgi:hypothetical protein